MRWISMTSVILFGWGLHGATLLRQNKNIRPFATITTSPPNKQSELTPESIDGSKNEGPLSGYQGNQELNLNKSSKLNGQVTTTKIIPASFVTKPYQPVIHLENSPGITRPTIKFTSFRDFFKKLIVSQEMNQRQLIDHESLNSKQLKSAFLLGRPGRNPLLRCQEPEATISIKCFANIARIRIISDSDERFDAKLSTNGTNAIILDGYRLIAYLTWWTKEEKVRHQLSEKLSWTSLKRTYHTKKNMEASLVLQEETHGCLIPVNCGQPSAEAFVYETPTSGPRAFHSSALTVASLALHKLGGEDEIMIAENIRPGENLTVLIRIASNNLPLEMYVKQCRLRMKMHTQPITLLSEGCSISDFLTNFKRVDSSTKRNVYMMAAQLTAFAIEYLPQNETLSCKIMICEGYCDVYSACQNSRSSRTENVKPRKLKTIDLEATFRFSPSTKTEDEELRQSTRRNEEKKVTECPEDDCIPIRMFYMYMFSLFLCACMLIFCIFYLTNKQTSKLVRYTDEVESPPKYFYGQSNARRRSPNSSFVEFSSKR